VTTDLQWLDATAQAALVRAGEMSPTELVAAALDRIDALNPALNAVIHHRAERARDEAAGDLPDGPFRGVPLLVKDLVLRSEGDPYHCGCRALRAADHRSDHDSTLMRRFRQAGFVLVGRTNVPENGSTITTEPLAYGPCRNPWDLDHSTGGSSGGSGAAVAAGLTPVAHGNDGGGSIRIPASECGIVGLKPSRGRTSLGPDVGESWLGGVVEGVLSRSVRDTAAVLDAVAGYEPGDPYSAPRPQRPWIDEVGAPPGQLRVGLLDHPLMPGVGADAECRAAVERAGRLLESLGHHVEVGHPAALEDLEFQGHFLSVVATANTADFDEWERWLGRPLGEGDLEPGNLLLREIGRSVSASQYLASVSWLHGFTRRMESWWQPDGFDVLVTPVLAGPPPPIGWLADPEHDMERVLALMQYTSQFNMSGQPAISLPLQWSSAGLPLGVQFVASYGREDLLIRLASQLEQAQPWAQRRPPITGQPGQPG